MYNKQRMQKLNGKCFSNKIVPNGWKIVKKNGKKVVCNKSLKCYCYKKSGKITVRHIEDVVEYKDYFESVESYDDYYLETVEEEL